MGKEMGEVTGCHCDNSSFISMLVCLFVISFFLCLFFSSSLFEGTIFFLWMEYRFTLSIYVCYRLFSVDLLYDHFCTGREKFQRPVGLLHCKNIYCATMKWFHVGSVKKIKEKSDIHLHVKKEQIFYRPTYACMH